jgi:hypothetical protein
VKANSPASLPRWAIYRSENRAVLFPYRTGRLGQKVLDFLALGVITVTIIRIIAAPRANRLTLVEMEAITAACTRQVGNYHGMETRLNSP